MLTFKKHYELKFAKARTPFNPINIFIASVYMTLMLAACPTTAFSDEGTRPMLAGWSNTAFYDDGTQPIGIFPVPGSEVQQNQNIGSSGDLTTLAIPANPGVDVTFKRNPISIKLYDSDQVDGDALNVLFNGKPIPGVPSPLVLSASPGITFTVQLEPTDLLPDHANRLELIAVNEGYGPPATIGLTLDTSQVAAGQTQFYAGLRTGQSIDLTMGMSQISYDPIKYPESSAHAAEAQGLGYARIVTVDRRGKNARRRSSIASYELNPINGLKQNREQQDYDEYPPAMFLENGGMAHVRPIDRSDNRGQGSTIGNLARPFADGDMLELIVP